MATAIDQKAYLRKYLAGAPEEKKKKKKKNIKGKGFKIIDDDLDISKLRPLYGDELDVYNEGEDAPQVVGIIDERPEELRKMDEASLTKWKVINQDDGFNSNLKVEEIKKDRKEVEKENEITFGKMYSDSEDEKKIDSDFSPPRKNSKTKKKSQNNSDSDFSPPRRRNKSQSDSDASPPRKNNRYENNSSSRTKKSKSVRQYDSDDSPPRVLKDNTSKRNKSSDIDSKNSKRSRKNYDSDFSPPRRSEKTKERVRRNSDSDLSPPRNKEKRYDSDFSPPRKNDKPKERIRKPSRWGHFEDQDTQTESTHRSRNRSLGSTMYKEDRHSKNLEKSRRVSPKHKRTESWSPERNSRHKNNQEYSKTRDNQMKNYRNKSPPPSNKKMEKTLDGKQAGLQDANRLQEENKAFRLREEELFQNMTDDLSGKNAKAVSRKGKRETSEDRQKQTEKAERQKALDEKYKKWSKGLKQVEDQQAAFQDYMHEASKPLARYKDDVDLEDKLKDVDRDGDPMLKYIKDRRRERGELGPEKPSYKGNFPPNRFNVKPGYRWDGVDRSNGYEKKYFEQQSKKKAQAEEAYKWSTEDL